MVAEITGRYQTISKLLYETGRMGESRAAADELLAKIKDLKPSSDRIHEAIGANCEFLDLIETRAAPLMSRPVAVVGPLLDELSARSIRYYGELMAIERYLGVA
jgi:hypothetical protein